MKLAAQDGLADYYAARAAEYDRIYAKPERQADLAALRACLPPQFAGKHVLEVACGTGYWTQLIAPAAAHVLALDAAPETLAIAQSRNTGTSPEKLHFVVGDAYQLPILAGRFNAAFAGFWYSHIPKQRQREFLLGLNAALCPGASVLLIDNRYVPGSSTPIAETDDAGNTYQTRQLQDGSQHRVLKNFPTEGELRVACQGLGEQVRVTYSAYFWALQYNVANAASV
jgi:SAM-dependent methyltransferase